MRKRSPTKGSAEILYTSAYGRMLGGGQHSLLLLLRDLDRGRYLPTLVCPEEGDLLNAARALGVKAEVLAQPPLRRLSLPTLVRACRLLRRQGIDLVHCDSPRQALYFGLAARLTGLPLVWQVRVGDPDHPLVDRCLAGLAHRIVAVSQGVAERFRALGFAAKTRVVRNGLDLSDLDRRPDRESVRQGLAIAEQELVVGLVGRLHPRKGHGLLLSALALLPLHFRERLRVLFIGDGDPEYRAELAVQAAAGGIGERLLFTGPREDVPHLLAGLDLFVLPTRFVEGFSRVVMEAMAAGLPVVTTAHGGNLEAIRNRETGVLIPPEASAADLALVIEGLLADREERLGLGERARAWAVAHFDHQLTARAMAAVYDELLRRSG